MNICFFIGKIISETKFDFIINSDNISILRFELEIEGKIKIQIKAYNEIADKCYKILKKGDTVFIYGKINKNTIEINEIQKI